MTTLDHRPQGRAAKERIGGAGAWAGVHDDDADDDDTNPEALLGIGALPKAKAETTTMTTHLRDCGHIAVARQQQCSMCNADKRRRSWAKEDEALAAGAAERAAAAGQRSTEAAQRQGGGAPAAGGEQQHETPAPASFQHDRARESPAKQEPAGARVFAGRQDVSTELAEARMRDLAAQEHNRSAGQPLVYVDPLKPLAPYDRRALDRATDRLAKAAGVASPDRAPDGVA